MEKTNLAPTPTLCEEIHEEIQSRVWQEIYEEKAIQHDIQNWKINSTTYQEEEEEEEELNKNLLWRIIVFLQRTPGIHLTRLLWLWEIHTPASLHT